MSINVGSINVSGRRGLGVQEVVSLGHLPGRGGIGPILL